MPADFTIRMERQLLEGGPIDTIDDEMKTVCYVTEMLGLHRVPVY